MRPGLGGCRLVDVRVVAYEYPVDSNRKITHVLFNQLGGPR